MSTSEVSMIWMEEDEQFLPAQIPQASEGETRSHRRRKKAKSEDEGAKKRRLREDQVKFLETCFENETKLEMGRKKKLAAELGIDAKQVAIWFQNRRARHKNKQVEEAYAKLRATHDAAVVEKCYLENEVIKLKQKLLEAEEEIRRLSPAGDTASGCSLSSTYWAAAAEAAAANGELGMARGEGGGDDFIYMHEYDFTDYMKMMEWVNFYGM